MAGPRRSSSARRRRAGSGRSATCGARLVRGADGRPAAATAPCSGQDQRRLQGQLLDAVAARPGRRRARASSTKAVPGRRTVPTTAWSASQGWVGEREPAGEEEAVAVGERRRRRRAAGGRRRPGRAAATSPAPAGALEPVALALEGVGGQVDAARRRCRRRRPSQSSSCPRTCACGEGGGEGLGLGAVLAQGGRRRRWRRRRRRGTPGPCAVRTPSGPSSRKVVTPWAREGARRRRRSGPPRGRGVPSSRRSRGRSAVSELAGEVGDDRDARRSRRSRLCGDACGTRRASAPSAASGRRG